VTPVFRTIHLKNLLIPWERCLGVEPGLVDPAVVAVMEQKDYDFAPVFQPVESWLAGLGLVSLQKNNAQGVFSELIEGILEEMRVPWPTGGKLWH